MARARIRNQFRETIDIIKAVPRGKEASMYGAIRDLFCDLLEYPRTNVVIDTAGEGGRPDVTVRAPSGLLDVHGVEHVIDWIVVEAKDEANAFTVMANREEIFAKKAKYIGPDTAWFVMIDPTVIVARPVQSAELARTNDIVLSLDGTENESTFLERLNSLSHNFAGVPQRLAAFRAGDETQIATEKLTFDAAADRRSQNQVRLARRNFYSTLRRTTQYLQEASVSALRAHLPLITEIKERAEAFGSKYHGYAFQASPISIRGYPSGLEETRAHDRDAASLRRYLASHPLLSRLALEGLSDFTLRTGAEEERVITMFGTETANLVLARILLIRFLEDHGFFGSRKYVCNGGVEAFQHMKDYFDLGYTKLLEDAYRQAGHLYAAAFDETDLDWIFGVEAPQLSAAIEWAMYQLSRFDFTTVKGDILTGIYDRFLDRKQRKEFGEYYTPPSIARFIIDRVDVAVGHKVFDPSCGSGTFLLETYQKLVGDFAERGIATYDEAREIVSRLCGNDLNTFSAILAQIQLLWHLLLFRDEIQRRGFPEIRITAKANSILRAGLAGTQSRFGEVDQSDYDAVIGNPPYVRPERGHDIDSVTAEYFSSGRSDRAHIWKGISPKSNIYNLFIFRALDSWCKQSAERCGRLGFIVPLSFCDANENADLRKLFQPGGRWVIREIVDLEVIWKHVFDADVLPIILIAEARPPKDDDTVVIRLADKTCIDFDDDDRPQFVLDRLPEQIIPYRELFSSDGRILTRLTSDRRKVLTKIVSNQTLRDIAWRFWVKRKGSTIVAWSTAEPPDHERNSWSERRLITGGLAFRGQKVQGADGGIDVYKGENVLAAGITGEAQAIAVDILAASDPSVWRFRDILPRQIYAIAQIETCPSAVAFDPQKIAFTNTATLFAPTDSLRDFPFDIVLLSRVYRFAYAIGTRMAVLNSYRSHIYPTNLGMLPWSEALGAKQSKIETLREPIFSACASAFQTDGAVRNELKSLPLRSLREVLREDPSAKITWSESFSAAEGKIEIDARMPTQTDDGWKIQLSGFLYDWVELTSREIADNLFLALIMQVGKSFDRAEVLALAIPPTGVVALQYRQIIDRYRSTNHQAALEGVIDKLDRIVGPALGLDESDLDFIRHSFASDPFLKNIKPRYPATTTRIHGFRTGLDSSTRYD